MPESDYVEITPGSGKKIEVERYTDGSGDVIERQSVAITSLELAIRQLITAISSGPDKDSLGRRQVFVGGGQISITSASLASFAYTGTYGPPAGGYPSAFANSFLGATWSDIRARIS